MQKEIIQRLDEMGQKLSFIQQRMIANDPEEFLTVRESCDFAKMSRSKFMEMKKEGLITVYKVKGKLLTKKSELISLIESMMVISHARRA